MARRWRGVRVFLLAAGVLAAGACAGGEDDAGSPVEEGQVVTVLAAGDIADCKSEGDELTAELIAAQPDATVFTLGDNVYDRGKVEEFQECYGPSWGQFKSRTRPATGNHDHSTTDAAGYHEYFGDAGGPFDTYRYSYDLGAWHIVVLNSDCWRIGGCEEGDPQIEWLRSDLEEHPARCTLAYWHRPPYSSGRYGDPKATDRVRPLWREAVDAGVDVVLTGHEHSYERFVPMDADGGRDDELGTQLFVVGTGGGELRDFKNPPLPTTVVRNDDSWGVLELTLRPGAYDWEFLPVAGQRFVDTGSGSCH